MASENKTVSQAKKRSGPPVNFESMFHQATVDWSDDHNFISPNEIHSQAVGLLFCLTTKSLINESFTKLYHRSVRITWLDLLIRERRNLKSNINSVEKCFVLNRLIAECTKNPYQFAKQTGDLYEQIKMCLSSALLRTWTAEEFSRHRNLQQRLLRQRRLFAMSDDEVHRPASLLTLQRAASQLFGELLHCYKTIPTMESYNRLGQFLEHCFLIVGQPSVSECVAATKYERTSNGYTAKLFARMICLLDYQTIEKHLILAGVEVTLYPFDRSVDTYGEAQPVLEWRRRNISDAEKEVRTFWFVELESVQWQKLAARNTRPSFIAKLCQLQFRVHINIKELKMKTKFEYLSEPFGLCSHAQYYPDYVAKMLCHEVAQSDNLEAVVQPEVFARYIARYYVRITGLTMKLHTLEYIKSIFQSAYNEQMETQNPLTLEIYEDSLGRIVSQIEMFVDHPFLSMMYHDGLLLGICDSTLDQQLSGTREEPHILLRFNTLSTHQFTQHASVRFLVHNRQLIRATFHGKAFVDEMCRMICEARSERAKKIRLLSETPNRYFSDFVSYFDEELFRLHTAASPLQDAYQPFIPILWNTMRPNTDATEQQQLNSPSLRLECVPIDLSETGTYSTNATQIPPSSVVVTTSQYPASTGRITIPTDVLVRHVADKLSQVLADSSTKDVPSPPAHVARAAALHSTLTEENVDRQKQLLIRLLHDYFPSQNQIEVSIQTSTPISDKSPASTTDDS